MKCVKDTKEFQFHNTVVALGKFDGLHLGHQALLKEVLQYKKNGFTSVIFTFDVSPRMFFQKENKFILSKEERRKQLEKWEIDYMIEYPFTKETASLSPEEFLKQVLVKQLGAKVIVVGEDFRFGYQRSGSVTTLQEYEEKYGYQVKVIEKQMLHEKEISSTLIRDSIEEGNMELAKELLGGYYSFQGEVVHGNHLGSTLLNMPTANMIPGKDKVIPAYGVYVARVSIQDEVYYGITNVGSKPTVEQGEAVGIETFLFDFNKDIYGESITVELLHHVRREQKFQSLEELKEQMHKDANLGKNYINSCFS